MIWIGTSGYNYPEWKGSFYPDDAAGREDAAVLRGAVSDGRDQLHVLPDAERGAARRSGRRRRRQPYKFTLKAPRRITHDSRLKNCEDAGRAFCRVAGTLQDKLGDAAVSAAAEREEGSARCSTRSSTMLPPRFRRRSSSATRRGSRTICSTRLRSRNLALCVADSEKLSTPVEVTADYAYFRLRDEGYTPDDIGVGGQNRRDDTPRCRDVFVYFKHEEEGKGPAFARLLMERARRPAGEGAEPRTPRSDPRPSSRRRRRRARPDEAAVTAVLAEHERDVRDCPSRADRETAAAGTNGSSSAVMMSVGTRDAIDDPHGAGAIVVVARRRRNRSTARCTPRRRRARCGSTRASRDRTRRAEAILPAHPALQVLDEVPLVERVRRPLQRVRRTRRSPGSATPLRPRGIRGGGASPYSPASFSARLPPSE